MAQRSHGSVRHFRIEPMSKSSSTCGTSIQDCYLQIRFFTAIRGNGIQYFYRERTNADDDRRRRRLPSVCMRRWCGSIRVLRCICVNGYKGQFASCTYERRRQSRQSDGGSPPSPVLAQSGDAVSPALRTPVRTACRQEGLFAERRSQEVMSMLQSFKSFLQMSLYL